MLFLLSLLVLGPPHPDHGLAARGVPHEHHGRPGYEQDAPLLQVLDDDRRAGHREDVDRPDVHRQVLPGRDALEAPQPEQRHVAARLPEEHRGRDRAQDGQDLLPAGRQEDDVLHRRRLDAHRQQVGRPGHQRAPAPAHGDAGIQYDIIQHTILCHYNMLVLNYMFAQLCLHYMYIYIYIYMYINTIYIYIYVHMHIYIYILHIYIHTYQGFYFLDKDKRGDFKTIESVQYIGAMGHPGGGKN